MRKKANMEIKRGILKSLNIELYIFKQTSVVVS